MAGLKKPAKKKDTGSPNIVVVLFLVFFVLLSIILGVWGYYGYDGQEVLRDTARKAKKGEEAAKLGERYWSFVARDSRLALGFPLMEEQDYNEMEMWKQDLPELDQKFKDMRTQKNVKEMIASNAKDLELENDKYKHTFRALLAQRIKERDGFQAEVAKLQADLNKTKKDYEAIAENAATFHKEALARISKDGQAALKASKTRTVEIEDAFKQNKQLLEEKSKLVEEHNAKVDEMNRQLAKLSKQIEVLREKTDLRSQTRDPRAVHALLLDMSRGKTLWDDPLGKITKADMTTRLVHINLGSAQGVKPELTFMVFGPGWNKRAEKGLKGTIEVIRVLDGQTSLARITSMYDAWGLEIPLTDQSRGRLEREASNPMKEGDLLYNLTFGSHVALAGIFNINGLPGDTPVDHMRHLNNFVHLLARQGVAVDAYVDLLDGQVKGPGITNKTRFLVIGDGAFDLVKGEAVNGEMPAKAEGKEEAGEKKEVEKKDAEKKEVEKKDAEKNEEAKEMPAKEGGAAGRGQGERHKTIAAAIQALRKEAAERGMFVISAENYVNVIGYRRPRSANDLEVSDFRPRQPAAGVAASDTAEKKAEDAK